MVYISKKRGIKDFFKTRNMKYYIAFMILFLAVIATIIIVSKRIRPDGRSDAAPTDTESDTESYNEPVTSARGMYRITINLATHMVTAYAYDETKGEYSNEPGRYMIAGIGAITEGSYQTSDGIKMTWFESDDGYYRYYSNYGNGIEFHSALYNTSNDKNSLNASDFNTIGTDTDTPGITLQLADAKWIYENCSYQSEFVIYSDSDEDVNYEFLKKTDIPEGITWDPTDTTDDNSVWCPTEVKLLECDSQIEVDTGDGINDIFKHVNARDKDDTSVISYVYITGKYNLDKAGEYKITLNLVDTSGNHLTKQITLIVRESESTEDLTTSGSTGDTKPASVKPDKQTEPVSSDTAVTKPDIETTPAEVTVPAETPNIEEFTSVEEFTTSSDEPSSITSHE